MRTFKHACGVLPVKHAGQLNKYNCSCNCYMCRVKTREKGNKVAERRKLEREKDYETEKQGD